MKLPLTDLRIQYDSIKGEIDTAIKEVLASCDFVLGKQLQLLEEDIARYFNVKYAVGVASGTDALVLSLAALGIASPDEVISTPFTFIATAEAVSRVGAKPVFADIRLDTYNLDPEEAGKRITSKTKAIIPVHLYGMPCDMDKIMALAKAHKLSVIEDCAQSFGAAYKGRKTGTFGECGILSFFPGKILGCFGDGGMVITNNAELAKKLTALRNHGSTVKYYYALHGFNSRLDTLQAAILRVKLRHADEWIKKRGEAAVTYNRCLKDLEIGLPPASSGENFTHAFNYYTIRVKQKRDLLQKRLKEEGIATAIYYPLSLHLQEVYKGLGYKKGVFPLAEQCQEEVLSLPMYPELSGAQIEAVCAVVRQALA